MAWAPPNLSLFPGLPSANGMPPGGASRGWPAVGAGDALSTPWTNFMQPASYARPFGGTDYAAAPGQQTVAANAGTAQPNGPPSNVRPPKIPSPRRRPWDAPQPPPVGVSQETLWSPELYGSTPENPRSSFDARWSGAAPPPSLPDMLNPALPRSQQHLKLSASGTLDPRALFSNLLDRGFNIAQAAALVGNMIQESSLDPAKLTSGENAHGLVQWRLDRWPNLQKFAAARGTSPDDPNTQLDFMMHEMRGSEASKVRNFLVTDDVQSANAALHDYFRYGDDSEATRLANALSVLGIPFTDPK